MHQVEAEYQKSFLQETKSLLLEAAKSRAETMSQEETQVRQRLNLRAELLRTLVELGDKLTTWHLKVCKRYGDSIQAMKTKRKQAEERCRKAEQRFSLMRRQLRECREHTEAQLKPYLQELEGLPARQELAVQVYQLVALSEQPLLPPYLQVAMKNLISKSPFERMRRLLEVKEPRLFTSQPPAELEPFVGFDKWPCFLLHSPAAWITGFHKPSVGFLHPSLSASDIKGNNIAQKSRKGAHHIFEEAFLPKTEKKKESKKQKTNNVVIRPTM